MFRWTAIAWRVQLSRYNQAGTRYVVLPCRVLSSSSSSILTRPPLASATTPSRCPDISCSYPVYCTDMQWHVCFVPVAQFGLLAGCNPRNIFTLFSTLYCDTPAYYPVCRRGASIVIYLSIHLNGARCLPYIIIFSIRCYLLASLYNIMSAFIVQVIVIHSQIHSSAPLQALLWT